MKKKIFKSTLTVVMLAVAGYGGYKAYAKYASNEMTTSLLMQNVEALTQEESTDIIRFAKLSPVECPISKVNGATAIYIKGVLIPAFGSYTVYGSKYSCEFNLFNNCNASSQTLCTENK